MAKCPGCKGQVQWDWCYDIYVVNDKDCIETKCIEEVHHTLDTQINVMQCPICKTVLGTGVGGEHGYFIYNIKELVGVDWETNENSYNADAHLIGK